LALSDFHLFRSVKNQLGGKHFTDDEEVEAEMRTWLRQQSKTSMLRVSTQWDKCFNVGGGHVKK
jgi:hypothetical protein